MSTTDTWTTETILCRWAESEWRFPKPVAEVKLIESDTRPYSDTTPTEPWKITVRALDADVMHTESYDEAIPFIHEVTRFAATLGGAA